MRTYPILSGVWHARQDSMIPRRAKIVCTIGPAVESREQIRELIAAGMDVARLNFSHGEHAEHGKRAETIRTES